MGGLGDSDHPLTFHRHCRRQRNLTLATGGHIGAQSSNYFSVSIYKDSLTLSWPCRENTMCWTLLNWSRVKGRTARAGYRMSWEQGGPDRNISKQSEASGCWPSSRVQWQRKYSCHSVSACPYFKYILYRKQYPRFSTHPWDRQRWKEVEDQTQSPWGLEKGNLIFPIPLLVPTLS